MPTENAVTVVVATRNRMHSLCRTLDHIEALPERPAVVVVDNASTDATAAAVAERHPRVTLLTLDRNVGAAARNVGVRRATTPYVAFSDDDSWWAPGALSRAAGHLDAHRRLGLLNARVLVGSEEQLDETCVQMSHSPLPAAGLPGPAILGFLACAAVVRRSAFLEAGGFEPRFGIGGEEELLAIDLARAGWGLAYTDDVVAHHHPSPLRDPVQRRRLMVRNSLWVGWMRRSPRVAWRRTAAALRGAKDDRAIRAGLLDALRGAAWVASSRRAPSRNLERRLQLLDALA